MTDVEQPHKKIPAYERLRWRIFGITWLAYVGFYLTRKAFWVAKIGIEKDPNTTISMAQMGWVDLFYGIAYAVGQFVWGISADKVGTRRIVTIGMLCSVVSACLMGASTLTIMLGIFFCIQGACQSTGWAPLTKNVGNFFSRRERGTVMGFWCTNYAFGGLVASAYAGFWGDLLGWRFAFFIPAATLLGIWILFLIFQRNRPEDVGLPPIEEYHGEEKPVLEDDAPEEPEEGSWKVIWDVIRNKTVLTLCVVYFLLKPTRYAILAWGPKYVNEKLGSGMTESGLISGLFEVAGILSALLGGIISDRFFKSRRMPVCVIFLVGLGVFMFFFDELAVNRLLLAGGYVLIGLLLFAPDTLISGTSAIDFGTRKGASTAAGFINGFGSTGQMMGLALPGFFAEKWGWDGVFTFLGAMVLLAAFILLFMWNAVPKSTDGTKTA